MNRTIYILFIFNGRRNNEKITFIFDWICFHTILNVKWFQSFIYVTQLIVMQRLDGVYICLMLDEFLAKWEMILSRSVQLMRKNVICTRQPMENRRFASFDFHHFVS